jgi:DNA-binding NtrC family response regulator
MARRIHELGGRGGRFVAVNCAAIPETLAASELFGARRGAFTGAHADRAGLIAAADGGTLFLDEIGELSPATQAMLLRALQEKEITPLGATQPVAVDLRLVAATHEDLEAQVAARRFRKDLYARLRGARVVLPPLRERRGDLGLLVAEILERAARPGLRFQRAAAAALLAHDWPLNIRELEHALGAALAVAPGDEIQLAHLPPEIAARPAARPPREETTRERFAELVAAHAGNVSAVAEALGTSRSQVRRLAQRFDVDLARLRG